MTKIERLEKRITELEAEVTRLKAEPKVEQHFHNHPPAAPVYVPGLFPPQLPPNGPCDPLPWGWPPITYTGAGFASKSDIFVRYPDGQPVKGHWTELPA